MLFSRTSVRPYARRSIALTCTALATLNFFPGCGGDAPSDTNTTVETETTEEDPAAAMRAALPVLRFGERSGGLPTQGTWLGYPRLCDLNGDGYDDLVASNRQEDGYHIWESPGGPEAEGDWIHRNEGIPDDMMYGSCAFADFDADGDTDLAINSHKDGLRLYLNDGAMKWTRSEAPIRNLFLVLDVATGDLNGDEFPDVAGIGHFKGGVSLYSGDGKAGLERMSESMSLLGGQAFGREIELHDLDEDGFDDVVTTSNLGMKVFFTRMAGDSLFWEERSDGLPNPEIGNSIYATGAGDFTGDGIPEIVSGAIYSQSDPEKRNTIGVYQWAGEGFGDADGRWVQIDEGLPREQAYRDLKIADFNEDGNLDLLAMNVNVAPIVYLGDGQGRFEAAGRIDCTGRGRCHVGDVDGDGHVDVAIAFSAKGDAPAGVRVFLNRPEAW